MPREAHTVITDDDGNRIEVWASKGRVRLWIIGGLAALSTEKREVLGQAYVAACNAADRQNAAAVPT